MLTLYRSDKINNLKRYLGFRIVALLSVFMVLLIVSYFFSSIIISKETNNNSLLNIAGQQRMLIYQYVSEISQSLVGLSSNDLKMALSEKNKADLTVDKFEKVLDAFENRSEIIVGLEVGTAELISSSYGRDINEHIKHVRREWKELKRIALLSLRSDSHAVSDSPYVQQLLQQANITVTEMNHIVSGIQDYGDAEIKRLDSLLLMMIIIGLVLFFMVVYFVYSRIITPLNDSVQSLSQAMQNLEQEKIRAEDASRHKSEFLSRMSHELRTPMNAILGFGQILELNGDRLDQTQRDNVKEILNAGDHLLNLINEVLDLAKIESGQLDVYMEEVSLDDALQHCFTMIKPQLAASQLEIIDRISNSGYTLYGDPVRLRQVLLNLLSNAVKYNRKQGSITLSAEIKDKNRLRISITDTGNGLTEDELGNLFTPFERLGAYSDVEGTGIGLVITKYLVELMGGVIGVESTSGEGSTFWIELKLRYED